MKEILNDDLTTLVNKEKLFGISRLEQFLDYVKRLK